MEGYAEAWPSDRYERLREILSELRLPDRGTALDFGCGHGSFSRMLRDALPGWNVVAVDVSRVALEDAARHSPGIAFREAATLGADDDRFVFIFSHHVLEHVPDLGETWRLFSRIAAPAATMLHVLPCGNAGSLEHRLCVLRTDGIDESREGRFFCDDEPHVRRVTSARLVELAAAAGFRLVRQDFNQHYWSQLWPMAQKPARELWSLTDWRKATGPTAAAKLLGFRALFLGLRAASWPTLSRWRLHASGHQVPGDYVRHVMALGLTPLSVPVTRYLRRQSELEWHNRRADQAGAEMYMVFRRDGIEQ